MKKKFLIIFVSVLLLISISIAMGQNVENNLIIKVKAEKIPESPFAPGVLPSENSYQVVTYKVLSVCKGELKEKEIKVAHKGGSERTIKIDEETDIKVHYTTQYRRAAEFLLLDFGIIIPEETIADFVFVGVSEDCSNL